MKRALYLSPGMFDKGGVARYCRFQVRALRELLGPGAVTTLSLLPPDADALEEPFGVDFASFGASPRGKAFFAAAAATAAAAERPAVVWAAHLGLGPLAVALGRAVRARSVVNVYGYEVWSNPGRLVVAGLRHAGHVLSDCHHTRNYAVEHGMTSPERSSVHWDCVDVDRFCPGDAGDVLARYGVPPAEGRATVITIGRMGADTRYKGFSRLLEVVARLATRMPVRLVLGGGGTERPALEARAHELGLKGTAFFAGRIHDHDLPAFYRAGDVFSMVTDFGFGRGEGMPLTPLEAAASGTPILVGNQDGSPEAVDDGVSGFVLDPFDLDAAGERIARLWHDPALRKRIGDAGRARIVREHSYARFRERTAELLGTLGVR
jgi:phosphatidyl-myo-inositol dimannoside synthase